VRVKAVGRQPSPSSGRGFCNGGPADEDPKQMHQDFRVARVAELEEQWRRAQELGAVLLYDRTGQPGSTEERP
jgi:hypothetical protein